MTAREQLVAYLATLGILALVIISALVTAAWVPEVMGKMEVFGLGTVTGGLIGVLRIPSSVKAPGPTGEANDPVTVKDAQP